MAELIAKSVRVAGSGRAVTVSDVVHINCTCLLAHGTVIYSSENKPKGLCEVDLTEDNGSMPRGLVLALRSSDLHVGDECELKVPAPLAYGAEECTSFQSTIPPHADLLFRVHVVDAHSATSASAAGAAHLAASTGKDWRKEAARHKEEGNKLLQGSNLVGAIAAYKQSASCIRMAQRQGGDTGSPGEGVDLQALHTAVHSNLALAYLKQGKAALAVEAADAVLSHEEKHEKALYRRAKGLQGLGRKGEGTETIAKLLAVNPANADALTLQAELEGRPVPAKKSPAPAGQVTEAESGGISAMSPSPSPSIASATSTGHTEQRTAGALPASSSVESGGSTRHRKKEIDPLASAAKRMFQSTEGGLYEDTPGYAMPLPDIRQHVTWSTWLWEGVRDTTHAVTCGLCCRRPKAKSS